MGDAVHFQNLTYEQYRDVALLNALNLTTGKAYFVHHTGADSGTGTSSNKPFATIDYAIGKCLANHGDTIIVMPGHNESITAATSLVVDVEGVSIIGLGHGHSRPILDFDGTAGSIELDAANCLLKNLVLRASVTATVVAINVDAHDIELAGLEFTYEDTGDDFITMVDIDAVDRTYVHHCRFNTEPDTAGCAEAIRLDDCEHTIIEDNIFAGDFTDSAIVGEGAAGKDVVIRSNIIYNNDTGGANYEIGVDCSVATTGILHDNVIGALYATSADIIVDPGSMLSGRNYVCNAINESGALVPKTTSV